MKTTALLFAALLLSACSTDTMLNGKPYEQNYTTKPTFCYQLAPQEQVPGKNCIGSGGHGN
ncbi:MAG TPA: hypothetical protein DD638_00945 [Pasteurellaceae bacterium]|nr:hypothetical protein [Pasteurellaceae bacterium]